MIYKTDVIWYVKDAGDTFCFHLLYSFRKGIVLDSTIPFLLLFNRHYIVFKKIAYIVIAIKYSVCLV